MMAIGAAAFDRPRFNPASLTARCRFSQMRDLAAGQSRPRMPKQSPKTAHSRMPSLPPLSFVPRFRDYLWGGRRLADRLGKPIPAGTTAAESWEVVDHGADQSIVANGPLAGKSLQQIVLDHPQALFGRHTIEPVTGQPRRQFPLLLKYLDCNKDLSVQVHPDDRYAQAMPEPDLGKTEAWYIVDAQPGSKIYAGLKPGTDRASLASAVAQQRTAEVLHAFEPMTGDCVFIPAGTVHALGAGLLVAEIQQASDTTFRLFDWNRVDAQGQSRPLHIDQALEVTDYATGPVQPVTPRLRDGNWQQLIACDPFQLFRAAGPGTFTLPGEDQFVILTIPRGEATLPTPEGPIELATGQSLLVPAACAANSVELMTDSTLLAMHL